MQRAAINPLLVGDKGSKATMNTACYIQATKGRRWRVVHVGSVDYNEYLRASVGMDVSRLYR